MNPMRDSLTAAPGNPGRRRFVLSVLVGLLAGRSLGGCDAPPTPTVSVAAPAPQWLLKITGEREAVVRLGNGYLASTPAERSLDTMLGILENTVAGELDSADMAAGDPAPVIAALQRVVRSDYQRNEVVKVNDWVLSRTEARLYGAVALLSAS